MDVSFNNLLARLALLGVELHCSEDSLLIANWLEQHEETAEVACLIRVTSLMGLGRCHDALALGRNSPWESVSAWMALCEQKLGLGGALEGRLTQLAKSDNPQMVQFASGMRLPEDL